MKIEAHSAYKGCVATISSYLFCCRREAISCPSFGLLFWPPFSRKLKKVLSHSVVRRWEMQPIFWEIWSLLLMYGTRQCFHHQQDWPRCCWHKRNPFGSSGSEELSESSSILGEKLVRLSDVPLLSSNSFCLFLNLALWFLNQAWNQMKIEAGLSYWVINIMVEKHMQLYMGWTFFPSQKNRLYHSSQTFQDCKYYPGWKMCSQLRKSWFPFYHHYKPANKLA